MEKHENYYDEACNRGNEFLKKLEEEAISQCGLDYQNYQDIHMESDGTTIILKREKNLVVSEVILQCYKDINDSWRSTNCFIEPDDIRFTRVEGNGKIIHIPKISAGKVVTKEEYDYLCNYLDNFDNAMIQYDQKNTTVVSNMVPEYYRTVLSNKCDDLDISELKNYPTIQAAVDCWGLALVDYLLFYGENVDSKMAEIIDTFKNLFATAIADKMIKNGKKVNIDFSIESVDYKFGANTILSKSLATIGIDVENFYTFLKDQRPNLNLLTDVDLESASLFCHTFKMETLCIIPRKIKKALDFWSYKFIEYLRDNRVQIDVSTIVRGSYFIVPIIEKYLACGLKLYMSYDSFYEISEEDILYNDLCLYFEELLRRIAVPPFGCFIEDDKLSMGEVAIPSNNPKK